MNHNGNSIEEHVRHLANGDELRPDLVEHVMDLVEQLPPGDEGLAVSAFFTDLVITESARTINLDGIPLFDENMQFLIRLARANASNRPSWAEPLLDLLYESGMTQAEAQQVMTLLSETYSIRWIATFPTKYNWATLSPETDPVA